MYEQFLHAIHIEETGRFRQVKSFLNRNLYCMNTIKLFIRVQGKLLCTRDLWPGNKEGLLIELQALFSELSIDFDSLLT